tara:strand:+ start:14063 stop:14752 length:690 start_codon:yes stop_codon:yes gene_type:complete
MADGDKTYSKKENARRKSRGLQRGEGPGSGVVNILGGFFRMLDDVAYTVGDAFRGTGKVSRGVGSVAKGAGYLAQGTGDVVRGSSGLVRRITDRAATKAEGESVYLSKKELHDLMELEPTEQAAKLRKYMRKGKGVQIPVGLMQDSLDHLVARDYTLGHGDPEVERRLRKVAAVLFLFTAIVFFDKTSITGYAVSTSTGTSLSGYYSLLGFAALGMAVLYFAYKGKRKR